MAFFKLALAYLEKKEYNYSLLKKENEVQLLEFLLTQSKLLLKELDEQD